MDRDSIDRIRSATFPVGRRGYEKREVDRFLNKLADWLETGGGDQTRAELVRRELGARSPHRSPGRASSSAGRAAADSRP